MNIRSDLAASAPDAAVRTAAARFGLDPASLHELDGYENFIYGAHGGEGPAPDLIRFEVVWLYANVAFTGAAGSDVEAFLTRTAPILREERPLLAAGVEELVLSL